MMLRRSAIPVAILSIVISAECLAADVPVLTFRRAGPAVLTRKMVLGAGESYRHLQNMELQISELELDGIARLDATRPQANVYFLPEQLRNVLADNFPPCVRILPTRAIEKRRGWSFTLGAQPPRLPPAEKLGENLYRRSEKGVDTYILVDGDITFISPSKELIEEIRPRAAELLREDDETFLFSVRFQNSRVPSAWKDGVLSALVATTQKWCGDGKLAQEHAEFMNDTFRALIEGCDTVIAGVNLGPDMQGSRIWLKLTAVKGSDFDDSLKLISPLGSRFCGRLDPHASLNVAIAARFGDSFVKLLNPKLNFDAIERLKENPGQFSKLQTAYDELSETTEIVGATTLKSGQIDALVSWTDKGDDSKTCISALVRGAQNIETPLRDFLEQAQATDHDETICADVAQFGDTHIHRVGKRSHYAFVKDAMVFASDANSLQQMLATPTPKELRKSTPPILVEGDVLALKRLIPALAEPDLVRNYFLIDDATLPGGRFRIAVEARDHSLSAELALDREATARVCNGYVKTTFGQFDNWAAIDQKRNDPAASAAKPQASMNDQEPADALQPANVSTRRRGKK